jgi:hypothetical protein
MDIILDYDSSTNSAPSGFKTAMQYAASQLDALITNNITISIEVSWDNAVLGEGGANFYYEPYTTVAAALKSHAETTTQKAAAATLPSTDPTSNGELLLTSAQEEALGLASPSDFYGTDGYVTFGSDGTTLNFSTTNMAVAGEIDFVGVAEHELTHAIGREDWGDSTPVTIQDLYRYASNGVYGAGTDAYFSINDGATNLAQYSATSDTSDWASATDDSFDAYASEGVANTISAVDKTLLSVIGFDVACYCAGTMISVLKNGYEQQRAIENLCPGDLVITKQGPRKIRFMGTRAYDGNFIAGNEMMIPVRIQAAALGDNLPLQDLFVSPGHAMLIDNVLIQAQHLVNGLNITQAASIDTLRYYHLGLNTHHVIKANGSWAESYCVTHGLDVQFENQAAHLAYRKTQKPGEKTYRPLVHGGEKLHAIRNAIAARAQNLLLGYIDEVNIAACNGQNSSRLRINGWAQNQADGQAETPVKLYVYAHRHEIGTTLANTYRSDLRGPNLAGGRHNIPTTGRHAFEFEIDIPAHITPQDISVRGENGQALPLSHPLPAQSAQISIFLKPNRAA